MAISDHYYDFANDRRIVGMSGETTDYLFTSIGKILERIELIEQKMTPVNPPVIQLMSENQRDFSKNITRILNNGIPMQISWDEIPFVKVEKNN